MPKPLARAGRWMIDCPTCKVPILIDLKQAITACVADYCPDQGKPIEVEWPKEIDSIEKLLQSAPEGERYYHPIWSAAEFKQILADPSHVVGP